MIVIIGPTSTGKTSLAIKLCQKFNGEVISADSRQVYKDMDIGTGKLPIQMDSTAIKKTEGNWEIGGVRIWGYDLVNPDKYFSAYDYAKFAIEKIKDIKNNGKKVLIVGGTGFYIDVITKRRKLSGVKPDIEMRKALEMTPTKNLLDKLKQMNPKRHKEIDKNNRRRIIRAVEIELSGEHKPSDFALLTPLNEPIKYYGLSTNRGALYKRADKWVDEIFMNGLLQETDKLMKKYPSSDKLNGIVYQSAVACVKKTVSLDEARRQAKYDLHKYIRRQLTYFRSNKEIKWFDIAKGEPLRLLNKNPFQ